MRIFSLKYLTNASRCDNIYKRENINAPVAQLVEHLTFNQGVRSSILRRSTKGLSNQSLYLFTFHYYLLPITLFPGCGAVGSLRAKTIDYRFHDAKSPKQGVIGAIYDCDANDYATACSAREGARKSLALFVGVHFIKFLYFRGVAQLVARVLWEQDTAPKVSRSKKRQKALQTLTFSALYSLAKFPF